MNNMLPVIKTFEDNRNSLTEFVRSQLLGEGALPNLVWLGGNTTNDQEVLNQKPTSLYSTGILFPKNISNNTVEDDDQISIHSEDEVEIGLEAENENVATVSDNTEEDQERVMSSNQMFLSNMGMTFCLSNETEDIPLDITFRTYKRLSKKEREGNVAAKLFDFKDNSFYAKFLEDDLLSIYLELVPREDTTFLLLKREPKDEEIRQLQQNLGQIKKDYELTQLAKLTEELDQIQYSESPDKELIREKKAQILNKQLVLNFYRTAEMLLLNGTEYWLSERHHVIQYINIVEFTKEPSLKKKLISPPLEIYANGDKGLKLHVQLKRDRKYSDVIFVKLLLENTSAPFESESPFTPYNNTIISRSIFGTCLKVESNDIRPFKGFKEYSKNSKGLFGEDETTKFLYRNVHSYGIGHSVSVTWNDKGSFVKTEYLPSVDIPGISPVPVIKGKSGNKIDFSEEAFLQFKWLSTLNTGVNDDGIIGGLKNFLNFYLEWINSTKIKIGQEDLGEGERQLAEQELKKCRADYKRMMRNVSLLRDKNAMLAFRLANTAMFMQLWHTRKVDKKSYSPGEENNPVTSSNSFTHDFYEKQKDDLFKKGQSATWRPFQLAFILLNLDGFLKPDLNSTEEIFSVSSVQGEEWYERNKLVDLVWFPTGGGKTEAYLGIIAFCIWLRKLTNGKEGAGTNVIMRYTLRLLTLQQFQRATRLIAALEIMRSWKELKLQNNDPISIGLWVGNNFLPGALRGDNNSGLADIVERAGENIADRNKIPITACPCCGTSFYDSEQKAYAGITDDNDVDFFCLNQECFYNEEPLPILLCDEQIYSTPPTLLFGTVDKFVQMAYKTGGAVGNDSRRLFGLNNLPPDLIIQDELHLLVGPLGSATALFETVVDSVSTSQRNGLTVRPKIISSTATTRNTAGQIRALYDRDLQIFPKPGVYHDDSFYAVYDRDDTGKLISTRRYIGINPTGKTQIKTQIQLLATLFVHRILSENASAPEKVMDYFFSTVSYFGSLREVGKTASQVETFIRMNYSILRNQLLTSSEIHRTYLKIVTRELTGRLTNDEVKENQALIETPYKLSNRKDTYRPTPDLVLATNMISVGLDISRLNTMIINSMPKNIAEYIQASSRVARDEAGVVFVLHHPFRVRDVSHYEHFMEFHQKLYSYVEPISITPFTNKAVNRYLSTALAAMVRQKENGFAENTSANTITQVEIDRIANDYKTYFEQRYLSVKQNGEYDWLFEEQHLVSIKEWIDNWAADWQNSKEIANDSGKQLSFNRNRHAAYHPLYKDPAAEENSSSFWRVTNSLREIEASTAFIINQE
ncbi:helicase-related protein [Rufibacter tibetensis]|uniref:Helicase C-terminal domain-containing protein n=1 Tax=Rufibacter tibetensis TaxID=512763 RepID=A0A0P0CSD3_9BACT|nr:helicase-related protein [Rufibacter tibetensis]ALI98086.1 hypothetical protein DC20_02720 [Rufibacter tibetensis]